MRVLLVTLTMCLFVLPAQAKYSGGTGEPNDPYQIATAADLIALGETPEDYDKHFILTADIDLDPNLPGRKVFDKAVIAPDADPCDVHPWTEGPIFTGALFTGVLDGQEHTISHLTINGGSWAGLFGRLGSGANITDLGVVGADITGLGTEIGALAGANVGGSVTRCYSSGGVGGASNVGGLVGFNSGSISTSYSTSSVSGKENVGGLIGSNDYQSSISSSYSSGPVSGTGDCIGGLVGINSGGHDMYGPGRIIASYSSGSVSGTGDRIGGLVGRNVASPFGQGVITTSFWDIQTSGQTQSAGGTGKTTAAMQTAETFLDSGWDFRGETKNGFADTWGIVEGKDYPRLFWEHWASCPEPPDGATDVLVPPTLNWRRATRALTHDVYFGDDKNSVANATPGSHGIYRGRQPAEMSSYNVGDLGYATTYYWRIDEVNEAESDSPWIGNVWTFTTANYVMAGVIDDFESYADDQEAGQAIFQTWIDGACYGDPNNPAGDPNHPPYYPGNGTGAIVGNWESPFAEQQIVHGGKQSMPMDYNNVNEPWYSETERTWETPQDWTVDGADTLTLYFRGEADNSPDPLYVGMEDSAGRMAVVVHPDPNAVLATEWQKWQIALDEVQAAGVDVAAVKKMVIGVGDRQNPKPGGIGRIYIDDIRLTKRMP